MSLPTGAVAVVLGWASLGLFVVLYLSGPVVSLYTSAVPPKGCHPPGFCRASPRPPSVLVLTCGLPPACLATVLLSDEAVCSTFSFHSTLRLCAVSPPPVYLGASVGHPITVVFLFVVCGSQLFLSLQEFLSRWCLVVLLWWCQ